MSNFSPLTIVFPIYPGVTQLDFTGPHQFFSRLPGVKPVVASIEGKPIVGDGLTFSDLVSLEQIDRVMCYAFPAGSAAQMRSRTRDIYPLSSCWQRTPATSPQFAPVP